MISRSIEELRPQALHEFRRLVAELTEGSRAVRSLMLTSPAGGEGTTTIAGYLALSLAEIANTRTLLIDMNLARPDISRSFGLKAHPGIYDWDGESEPFYQQTPLCKKIHCLASGYDQTQTGSDSKWGGKLCAIANRVKEDFDFVLWDAPPVTLFPEAEILAPLVDGVIVVLEADVTRVDKLTYVRDRLTRAGANIVGAIVNRSGRFVPWRTGNGE